MDCLRGRFIRLNAGVAELRSSSNAGFLYRPRSLQKGARVNGE